VIRKSYAALRNLITSLPNHNLNPNPNLMLSGQLNPNPKKPARIHITGQGMGILCHGFMGNETGGGQKKQFLIPIICCKDRVLATFEAFEGPKCYWHIWTVLCIKNRSEVCER
jgi:hypothetical protein